MKSPICILLTSNLKHCTLISHYTGLLNAKNINYDIIYFDRYGIEEESQATNIYKYTEQLNSSNGKVSKTPTFLRFRKYAVNILKQNNYKFVITWNTFTIFLFYTYLKGKKIPYIHNIRDYFNEKNPFINLMQNKVSNDSLLNTISSQGFRRFLPDQKYMMVHSMNEEMDLEITKLQNSLNKPIKIGFVGNVRFVKEQERLIQLFKNDERFMLYFCGTNSEKLQDYIDENKVHNVELKGAFEPSETNTLINEMTLINNIFGNESDSVSTLTSIRLYYSTLLYRPILVNNNTHMADLVEKNGIGFSLDFHDINLKERVYEWVKNLDYDSYKENCDSFNKRVKEDNENFKKKFETILKDYL